jgi:nitroreductase
MPTDMVLHQDHYRDPDEAQMAAYDATMADYYQSRGSNVKLSDWTTGTANAVQGKKREHMLAFLRARGFFKR